MRGYRVTAVKRGGEAAATVSKRASPVPIWPLGQLAVLAVMVLIFDVLAYVSNVSPSYSMLVAVIAIVLPCR